MWFAKFQKGGTMRTEISGHFFEEATLGLCGASCRGYMPWRDAFREVCKHQPRTPRPAAAKLVNEISRQSGLAVKFFTAVRSTLDQFHSVDGIFDFDGVLVTIDVTTNPSKVSGKADVIVYADDFNNLFGLADRIVCEYKMKAQGCATAAAGRR